MSARPDPLDSSATALLGDGAYPESQVSYGGATYWLERPASFVDGVRAVAVGIAGNESLRTGQPVVVTDLDLGVDLSR